MSEKFDVIAVRAGPAGIPCSFELAKAGLKVALIERGEYPGAKNVMGGIIYRNAVEEMVPNFWEEKGVVERPITEQRYMILDERSGVTIGHKDIGWAEPPYNCFSVMRSKFDQWFSGKAVEQGVLLINETVVTDCIIENNKVVGIRTDRPDGELRCDVVVVADGVNSLLAKQLGMRDKIKPSHVALAAMEIIKLDQKTVEDRFGLEGPNQGCTIELFGESTKSIMGTAFIYSNKDSVSIGVGTLLNGMIQHRLRPYELLDALKSHPAVRHYIQGGETAEYLAHLIPEGGYNYIPELVGDGVVLVGDAAGLVNGIHREGSNLAMKSGRLAAETIIQAKEREDYSKSALSPYREKLMSSFVGQDLKKYKDTAHYLDENPRYFENYLPMMNMALRELFTVDGQTKWQKQKNIMERAGLNSFGGKIKLAKDLYRVWKVMK